MMGWLTRSRPKDLIADCLAEWEQTRLEGSAAAARDPFQEAIVAEMMISMGNDPSRVVPLVAGGGWCAPSSIIYTFPEETI